MKAAIIVAVILIVLGALGWFIYTSNQSTTQEPAAITQTEEASSTTPSTGEKVKVNTITYTDSGFSPRSLTIKSGETVKWVNESGATIQIGSATHPSHTANPELTNNKFVIELALGGSSSVQLTKTGEWGYHNHLKPEVTGTIIVE